MGLLFRLACLAVLVSVAHRPQPSTQPLVMTGDVVLQTSRSSRSALIRHVSQSPYSHVGLIEVASDGIFVIEAIEPVSRTPWKTWRARGVGGKVTVLRAKNLSAEQRATVISKAKSWLGKPYDAHYRWDDERLYCSELVTKAFAAIGVELGQQEQVGSLALTPEIRSLGTKLGISTEQYVVTPASIADDVDLELVSSDFAR